MSHVVFDKTKPSFFEEMKEKIDAYFSSNEIKKTGNRIIYVKTVVFVFSLILTYIALLFFKLPVALSLSLWAFLGLAFAGIGFNIMHDGAHGSYSSKKWLNELVGYSLNVMGGNVFIWKSKHNFNHHTYTNIDGLDDDIDIQPWMRTHHDQPKHWYHRYQHIYAFFLYTLIFVNWIFVSDFKSYFSKKIGKADMAKMDLKEHVIFWTSKLSYVVLFIVFPIIKLGLVPTLIGLSIKWSVCGLMLGIVFQLAHLMDGVTCPSPIKDSNKMEQNWILHQIDTTVNFATSNRWIFWYTGGLNFQVVHHLFPKISHVHYPKINLLIKETCQKFNVKYTEYPNLWRALCSHVAFLKRLGS